MMEIRNNFPIFNPKVNAKEEPLEIKDFYGTWVGWVGFTRVEVQIRPDGATHVSIPGIGMSMNGQFSVHNERPTFEGSENEPLYGEVSISAKLLKPHQMEVKQFSMRWPQGGHVEGSGNLVVFCKTSDEIKDTWIR